MSFRTGRFRRSDRLLQTRDYHRVGRKGRRLSSPMFVVLVAPTHVAKTRKRSPGGSARLGVTASRRVGGAVVRNRVKRTIREWFRQERDRLESSSDIVVIARHPAAQLSCREIFRELDRLTSKSAGRQRAGTRP